MNKGLIIICLISLLLISAIIYLINSVPYKTKNFQRSIFLSESSTQSSEALPVSEGFIKPSSLIDVQYIHSGNLKERLSHVLNLNDPACAGIQDKDIVVPVFAYLIHHQKYGYFLIDSGCDASYVNDAFGPMEGVLFPYVMSKTVLEPNEAIENQLSDHLQDIKGVFFTHLHFDHTSGLPVLPKNLLYIAGKGEKSLSIEWLLKPNHFKESDTLYMIDFNSELAQTFPTGKAVDIFGDQTLWAIATPGHSKGHISYLVNSKEAPILIAGDACIINKSLETGIGSGSHSSNSKLAQKSFDQLVSFLKANPEVKIWPGHDFPQ